MIVDSEKKIILFDGVCNLCNSTVDFIIRHDKKHEFYFASLQSELGQEVIKKYNLGLQEMDSVLLLYKNNLQRKSSAALQIALQLGFPMNLLSIFLIVPSFTRDIIYDFIATNRYRWFGKKETCRIPTPEERSRFIS